MPELHAKLGPSSAERWMTCAGSVHLSEGMPNKSSVYADEGTLAHSVAEQLLNGGLNKGEKLPDGMVEHVGVYVGHVTSLADSFEGISIEQRVKVTDELWGTADAIIWRPDDKQLHVVDLKYGAGVPVEVEGNLQLKIYALAALLTFGYPAKTVTATIVQPRCHHSDGPIRSITFDALDLLDFHADLLDAIDRIVRAKPKPEFWLKPSEKGCRWCLAAPKCPALKSKAQILAKQVFAPTVAYKPEDLAETLDFLPILEGWIKNVRSFSYDEAERGHPIPNYKLVEKIAARKLKADVSVTLLADLLGVGTVSLYKPEELLGIGELEKLAPGKNAAERAKVLAPFVDKVSSGHALVHDSDKRDPVRIDAKAVFAPKETT